ncbi:hypothetical protein FRB95_009666 [Tulasnella sp. JGI-2019a]|nr:hypothetical protein FRB95_009666 [Tulasnella sp. JGI-2019a]
MSNHPKSTHHRVQRSYLACLRCRVRKTQCDGETPCMHCLRSGSACLYEDRRKPVLSEKDLTEKLAKLESRYQSMLSASDQGQGDVSGLDRGYQSPRRSSDVAASNPGHAEVVSPQLREYLLGIASMYLRHTDFDKNLLYSALANPLDQRVPPALENALMLLAHWYATPNAHALPSGTPPAEYFVQQIRIHLTNSLEQATSLVSHMLASSYLTWWLFQNGRFLEGQFEISSTARLAIHCGLHQIDEDIIKSVLQGVPPVRPRSYGILGLPASVNDLIMRVATFWKVYLMDKNAAIATGLPAAFDDHVSDPNLRITTVWSRAPRDYTGPWSINDFASIDDLTQSHQLVTVATVNQADFKTVSPPATTLAASTQAMTLMLRAAKLSTNPPQTVAEAQALRTSLITLNNCISRITATIPTLPSIESIERSQAIPPFPFNTESAHSAFFSTADATAAAYVIIIQMHRAAELLKGYDQTMDVDFGETSSREKRVGAARAVATVAQKIVTELDNIPNPKAGTCMINAYWWTCAAIVLVEEVVELRKGKPVRGSSSPIALLQAALDDYNKLLVAIKRLVPIFPVLEDHVRGLEKAMKDASA